MRISITEKIAGRLDDESLDRALQQLRELGYVVLESVFPEGWIPDFLQQYLGEAGRQYGDQWPKTHGGISSPMCKPFLDPLVIQNPFAMQILSSALGEDFFAYLPYGSNTAWPGSPVQHIHRDSGHLFPDTPYVLPMSTAVVNIPLVDFSQENGATEVWPASHLIADAQTEQKLSLEARVKELPSVRVIMPAGSVVVRDMRCWHRGMPNRTAQPRPMLALVYFRKFHHLPNDATTFRRSIDPGIWDQFSEPVQHIYRFNQPLNCS